MKHLAAVCAVVLLSATSAPAATHFVGGEQPAFATIQAGIDAASPGDTVVVRDGTYTGDGNRDIDFKGKAITVKSENGPEGCIIDSEGSEAEPHRGFVFHSGEDEMAIVEGFTITGGYSTDFLTGLGGGIYCAPGSSPTVTGNIITGNEGAGISCGALSGSTPDPASPVITGNTIADNTGVGVFCSVGSSPTVSGNLIARNSDSGIVTWSASPTISGNEIINNGDGGITCSVGTQSPIMITGNVISGNTTTALGGGIFSAYCLPHIINNVIAGNKADGFGGGIFMHKELAPAQPVVANNTIVSNQAGDWGGGVHWYTNREATITGCIIRDNIAPEGSELSLEHDNGGTLIVSYSNIAGGQDGVLSDRPAALAWGPGNIDADPLFVEPGSWDANEWTPGDYHLKARGFSRNPAPGVWIRDTVHSPCIDAADPSADFALEPYPNGGRVNMGAYGGTVEAARSNPNADINGDRCVNVADLLSTRGNLGKYGSEIFPFMCDVNNDGVCNIADLLMIRNRLGEGPGCPK